jgi:hypothetical protein
MRRCDKSKMKVDNGLHQYLSPSNEITLVLDYVYEIFEKNVPNQRYLVWALVDPLIIYWSTLTK